MPVRVCCSVWSAPAPNNAQTILATKCIDEGKHAHHDAWFEPWGEDKCSRSISAFDDPYLIEHGIAAERIVFAIRFPLPKEKTILDMSRWFQNIMAIINIDKTFSDEFDTVPGE